LKANRGEGIFSLLELRKMQMWSVHLSPFLSIICSPPWLLLISHKLVHKNVLRTESESGSEFLAGTKPVDPAHEGHLLHKASG
jgi:hypothetical protein